MQLCEVVVVVVVVLVIEKGRKEIKREKNYK
jgi:hypothetical protein